MRKVKLIVHETYQGKRKTEDVFAAVFLSNAATLTPNTHSGIIKDTERMTSIKEHRNSPPILTKSKSRASDESQTPFSCLHIILSTLTFIVGVEKYFIYIIKKNGWLLHQPFLLIKSFAGYLI